MRSGPAATLMRVLGLRRSARLPAALIRTRVAKRPLRHGAGALPTLRRPARSTRRLPALQVPSTSTPRRRASPSRLVTTRSERTSGAGTSARGDPGAGSGPGDGGGPGLGDGEGDGEGAGPGRGPGSPAGPQSGAAAWSVMTVTLTLSGGGQPSAIPGKDAT